MIHYIGVSGKLNAALAGAFLGKNISIYSASEFDTNNFKYSPGDILIWGGRYLPPRKIVGFGSKMPCFYLSTYFYNEFYDEYQASKLIDSDKLKSAEWNIISIPFVKNFLPKNVSAMLNDKTNSNSGYFIKLTEVEDIKISIESNSELQAEVIMIPMSMMEKMLWVLFSKLYILSNKLPFRVNRKLVFLVKLIEKVFLFLFSKYRISCVYIGKFNSSELL